MIPQHVIREMKQWASGDYGLDRLLAKTASLISLQGQSAVIKNLIQR